MIPKCYFKTQENILNKMYKKSISCSELQP